MHYASSPYGKRGMLVRLAYLCVALLTYLLQKLLGWRRGVVVLCYHSVSAAQRAAFDRQMRCIADRAISLDRIDEQASDGKVAVTFDDAFACLIDNAVPAADKYQVPIAIFAVSENLGKLPGWLAGRGHPDAALLTMTAEQLRQVAREPGCLIGSHSAHHRRLGDLPAQEAEAEIAASRTTLEHELGLPCRYLALPHGSYRPEVIELAMRHGYRKVLTLDEIAIPSQWPNNTIGRFSASPDMWRLEFLLTANGAYAWLRPWRTWLRRLKRSLAGASHAG